MLPLRFRAWDEFYGRFIYGGDPGFPLSDFFAKVQGGLDAGRNVPIEQSTGRNDRNGVKVYFGDIVEWSENYVAEGGKKFSAEVRWSPTAQIWFPALNATSRIIGNIHQNPELLN